MDLQIEKYAVEDAVERYFGVPKFADMKDENRPSTTADVIRTLGELGVMLCGGAINSIMTGTKINDLDFYVTGEAPVSEVQAYLGKFFTEPPYVTDNAVTYKRKSTSSRKVWTVQLITRFIGDAQYVLDTFDFTITQGVYDFATKDFIFGDRFLQDIAKRRLVYLGKSHYPICAMHRTKKYQARGYYLPGSTIMHIALSIVRLEITNYKQLKEQLMGIDTSYLTDLLNHEKYNDALPVDFGMFLAEAFEKITGISQDDIEQSDGDS